MWSVIRRLKNVIRWIPILWKHDCDWDFKYTAFILLREKARQTRLEIGGANRVSDSAKVCKELLIFETLCQRILNLHGLDMCPPVGFYGPLAERYYDTVSMEVREDGWAYISSSRAQLARNVSNEYVAQQNLREQARYHKELMELLTYMLEHKSSQWWD